jgi:phosphate transport system protein
MLQEKIINLKGELLDFASLVEKMIEGSISGLLNRDTEILKTVMGKNEDKANSFEIEIDETCVGLIAQFQPKAKDLRTILMVMQMNNDIERMGDHAVNISESALFLIARPAVKPLIDIPRMAELSIKMLKDSLVSFTDENPDLARQVCERDNEVDALGEQVLRELITFMSGDTGTIERSLHLLRISRNLERIADLSTNICEDTIFITEGRVIKHHMKEE